MEDKQTKTPDIRKNIVLNADAKKVWNVVATSEGIALWFMENDFQPEPGHEFTLQSPFGPSPCKVLTVDPLKSLAFSWDVSGWQLSFELKEMGDQTEFTLIHSGWGDPEAIIQGPSKSTLEVRNTMDQGWEGIVNGALRKVVEE